jgi:hypothetical protein
MAGETKTTLIPVLKERYADGPVLGEGYPATRKAQKKPSRIVRRLMRRRRALPGGPGGPDRFAIKT